MAKNQFILPLVPTADGRTVRLGAGSGAANQLSELDVAKPVKLVAESRYDLCVAGDTLEGYILSVSLAAQNGFTVGTLVQNGSFYAVLDGLQGTPGTGVVAIGDYVVAGTITAKGTALATYAKVCKATSQAAANFAWRVESLGDAGTGAVGTLALITRV